jgi:hypothetical protein
MKKLALVLGWMGLTMVSVYAAAAPPVITGFNPGVTNVGGVVTITGTNFSSIASSNIVFFGSVQAAVQTASAGTLTVTVPFGTTYAPITVTVNGLTAYANSPFFATFAGNGTITSSSFAPQFSLSAGSGPNTTAIGDLDGDGKPDLVLANQGGTIVIYRNISTNGTLAAASFAPPAIFQVTGTPVSIELADLDGDGRLDLVLTDNQHNNVSVFQNFCIPGSISTNLFGARVDFPVGSQPYRLAVRDLDGDGHPDIVTANSANSISILQSTGQAGNITTNSFAVHFELPAGGGPSSVAIGDLDGDGRPDIAVSDGLDSTISIFRNVSTGGRLSTNSFAARLDLAAPSTSDMVAFADVDGDGKLDMLVPAYLGQVLSVFHNVSVPGSLTANSFEPRLDFGTGGRAHRMAVADLDGDGKPDIAVVTELPSQLVLFKNKSTPGVLTNTSLAPGVAFSTGWNANAVSIADLDGDGQPDIFVSNTYDNDASVYRNLVPPGTSPIIVSAPTNQTVVSGRTATITVVATGLSPLSYQWSHSTTNIANATNATLLITNVQLTDAGTYSVLVTNTLGSTNVSATLAVVFAPAIIQQPQSQTVASYNGASFFVAANGTGPLSYQWRKNGNNLVNGGNISGATSTNLNLASVTLSDAGNYDVVVTSPYASTNSTVAVLTVPQTVLKFGLTGPSGPSVPPIRAMSGGSVVIPVMMDAVGEENAFQASVGYDPTKLVLQNVQLGAATAGAYLQEVDTQTNTGYVGFSILMDTGFAAMPAGSNQEVAQLVFMTVPVTNSTTVNLVFGDNPVDRATANNSLQSLPTIYQNGTVVLAPFEYEGDVYPRFGGDRQVNLFDWLEVGRMVAGLDVPTNMDELFRADCAPRNAPDGMLTVADWVQAGRYAAGLDPLTLVTLAPRQIPPGSPPFLARTVLIGTVAATQRGQSVNVPVQLNGLGGESAVGLTVGYDTNRLTFLNATLDSSIATNGGKMNINSNQAGELGLALALAAGKSLAQGTNQVAVLQFATASNASGTLALALDNSVVILQVADYTATILGANYVNGAVVLPPQPSLTSTMSHGQLQLSWPIASGGFQVESASSLYGPWTTSGWAVVTNGANASVTTSATNHQQYFRLVGQ